MSKGKHLDGLSEVVLKHFEKEVGKLAEDIGHILERETRDVLGKKGKDATGNLIQSVSHKARKMAWGYMITCFTNADYSVYVHDGTKPHWPPVDKIQKWVRIKKLAASYSEKGNRQGGTKRQHAEDRRVAWLIARKIARKGTKGIKFFDIALKQAMPLIKDKLLEESK